MLRNLDPKADHCGALLATALGSLYVGRDNKALIVTSSGVIVSANELAAEFCGLSREQLINTQLATILLCEPAIESSPRAIRWDTTLISADGTEILVEVVREPLPNFLGDLWVYALRDYRDRKADLLAASLESLFIGRDQKALIVARDGVIISVNLLAAMLLDHPSDDLVGKCSIDQFFSVPAGTEKTGDRAHGRWNAMLKLRPGVLIPVEVVREPLGTRFPDIFVYAIRDMRKMRGHSRQSGDSDRTC